MKPSHATTTGRIKTTQQEPRETLHRAKPTWLSEVNTEALAKLPWKIVLRSLSPSQRKANTSSIMNQSNLELTLTKGFVVILMQAANTRYRITKYVHKLLHQQYVKKVTPVEMSRHKKNCGHTATCANIHTHSDTLTCVTSPERYPKLSMQNII